jgi:hypothetical protein
MKTDTLLLFGVGAYLLYQYAHHPPSPPMQPPGSSGGGGGGGVDPGSNAVWTGIRWLHCSDPDADPTMCAQLAANPT